MNDETEEEKIEKKDTRKTSEKLGAKLDRFIPSSVKRLRFIDKFTTLVSCTLGLITLLVIASFLNRYEKEVQKTLRIIDNITRVVHVTDTINVSDTVYIINGEKFVKTGK